MVATKGLGSRHDRHPKPRCITEADSSKRPSPRAEALGRVQDRWHVQVLQAPCTKVRTYDGRGQALQDTAAGVTTVAVTGE